MKMDTKQIVLSRMLPKTGQSTEYRVGDDGTYQTGWWKGLTLAGNRTRFVSKTIGVDKVVIDNATGLMWAADGNEAGCYDGVASTWHTLIDYVVTLDFAGFTDWRVPNILEILSIVDYGASSPAIYTDYFLNTGLVNYISSNAYNVDPNSCWYVSFINGLVGIKTKAGGSAYLRSVRSL